MILLKSKKIKDEDKKTISGGGIMALATFVIAGAQTFCVISDIVKNQKKEKYHNKDNFSTDNWKEFEVSTFVPTQINKITQWE